MYFLYNRAAAKGKGPLASPKEARNKRGHQAYETPPRHRQPHERLGGKSPSHFLMCVFSLLPLSRIAFFFLMDLLNGWICVPLASFSRISKTERSASISICSHRYIRIAIIQLATNRYSTHAYLHALLLYTGSYCKYM